MTEGKLTPNLAQLPALDDDAREDAMFRAADRHWIALGLLFDRYAKEQDLTYAALGKRIKRSRSQVQRWLQSPANMTLASAGLLAEGLDAYLEVSVIPRGPIETNVRNYAHPCVRAAEQFVVHYSNAQPENIPMVSTLHSAKEATSENKNNFKVEYVGV